MPEGKPDTSKVVRTLNSLLRSESSATESYSQAIPRVGGSRPSDVEVLRTIAKEHVRVVQKIRAAIERVGATPDESSGVWPAFNKKPVDGPGKVFGDAVTLQALRDGEERGLEDYREALERVNDTTGALIAEEIIPARVKHIRTLDDILSRL